MSLNLDNPLLEALFDTISNEVQVLHQSVRHSSVIFPFRSAQRLLSISFKFFISTLIILGFFTHL
jgi:hypothetical protein